MPITKEHFINGLPFISSDGEVFRFVATGAFKGVVMDTICRTVFKVGAIHDEGFSGAVTVMGFTQSLYIDFKTLHRLHGQSTETTKPTEG